MQEQTNTYTESTPQTEETIYATEENILALNKAYKFKIFSPSTEQQFLITDVLTNPSNNETIVSVIEKSTKQKLALSLPLPDDYVIQKIKKSYDAKASPIFSVLKQEYPLLFTKPYVPFAKTIKEQILEKHPDIKPKVINRIIKQITSHPLYLENIIRNPGGHRFNLDSTHCETTIEPNHSFSAQSKLRSVLWQRKSVYISKLSRETFFRLVDLAYEKINFNAEDENLPQMKSKFIIFDMSNATKCLDSKDVNSIISINKQLRSIVSQSKVNLYNEVICLDETNKHFNTIKEQLEELDRT